MVIWCACGGLWANAAAGGDGSWLRHWWWKVGRVVRIYVAEGCAGESVICRPGLVADWAGAGRWFTGVGVVETEAFGRGGGEAGRNSVTLCRSPAYRARRQAADRGGGEMLVTD